VPIASAESFVHSLLDGIGMPSGVEDLAAYIDPPDPNTEAANPTAIIVSADGPEKRLVPPRNTGPGTTSGQKTISHTVRVLVYYYMAGDDPESKTLFAGIMDGIMDRLRTSYPSSAVLIDPYTGNQTTAIGAGEEMTYQRLPPQATQDQGINLWQGIITVPILEVIQA
jgi:hypothetical protein